MFYPMMFIVAIGAILSSLFVKDEGVSGFLGFFGWALYLWTLVMAFIEWLVESNITKKRADREAMDREIEFQVSTKMLHAKQDLREYIRDEVKYRVAAESLSKTASE